MAWHGMEASLIGVAIGGAPNIRTLAADPAVAVANSVLPLPGLIVFFRNGSEQRKRRR